jgi:hypothetical protein
MEDVEFRQKIEALLHDNYIQIKDFGVYINYM